LKGAAVSPARRRAFELLQLMLRAQRAPLSPFALVSLVTWRHLVVILLKSNNDSDSLELDRSNTNPNPQASHET
jgi:hypothetical protein